MNKHWICAYYFLYFIFAPEMYWKPYVARPGGESAIFAGSQNDTDIQCLYDSQPYFLELY